MRILKGILHHWNKTNSAYDTIHPETESAQITDWHSGIMSSLASKTLGTVVDAVTTDSVLGKLIKMLLNASGVKYNIADNGYVCLGSFFGGLIIQWVIASSTGTNYNSPLPISLTHGGTVVGMDGSVPDILYAAMLSDTHTIQITTNIEGYWAFRAIIVGF